MCIQTNLLINLPTKIKMMMIFFVSRWPNNIISLEIIVWILWQKTLQSATTQVIVENYRASKRDKRRLFKDKKREQERRTRVVEIHRSRNDARSFYQQVKRLTEDYKPEASSCKDENGNLVADPRGVLRLWRKHFSTL